MKMARPRTTQFADDMGISTNQAKRLIKEGRRRRDGGSAVLENNMSKMKEVDIPIPRPAPDYMYSHEERQKRRDRRIRERGPRPGDRNESRTKTVTAKDGKYMCRGGRKAIQGTKFRGVK